MVPTDHFYFFNIEKGQTILSAIGRFLYRTDVMLFLLCVVIFTQFPAIDIAISNWFYDAASGKFIYKNQVLIHFIYELVSLLPYILLPVLPLLAWRAFRKYRKNDARKVRSLFLLLCLLIGPGLLVNTILKDNSIGRARPNQIQEFKGDRTFTAAFEYSGQCSTNCSFVSGHAAMGFFFITLGWFFASRSWFYAGFTIGVIVSIGRIIQGAHFLSDIVFAFWAVYIVACLLGWIFNLPNPATLQRPRLSIFAKLKPFITR